MIKRIQEKRNYFSKFYSYITLLELILIVLIISISMSVVRLRAGSHSNCHKGE